MGVHEKLGKKIKAPNADECLYYLLFLGTQNYPTTSKWNHSPYIHAKHWDGTMVRISTCHALFLGFKHAGLYSFFPTTVFFSRGMLHSNPMDYAWGANGLDAIITQVAEEVIELYK